MKKIWQLKKEARELRKFGWTYPEIQNKVPVHRITLSRWCRNIELTSQQIKSRGERYANGLKGARANHFKRQKEIEKVQKEAEKEIHHLNTYEFKIAGAALYWGEGNKKSFAISNSDPNLINFIIKWFREICLIPDEKFKACLYLHTGHNEKKMKKYWSRITGIPLNQFTKTIFKQEGSASRKYSQSQYKGTIKVQVFDEDLKHRIFAWIEQLQFYLNR